MFIHIELHVWLWCCPLQAIQNAQAEIYAQILFLGRGQCIHTGCPGRNVPDFGRTFLKLKYTDLTKNIYIWSWTVMEIMTREKCGLLAVPRTVPGSRDVLPVHCTCLSFSLQPTQAHSRFDCTCKVLGTLRTTATLVRVLCSLIEWLYVTQMLIRC